MFCVNDDKEVNFAHSYVSSVYQALLQFFEVRYSWLRLCFCGIIKCLYGLVLCVVSYWWFWVLIAYSIYLMTCMYSQYSRMQNHSTNFITLLMSNKISWQLKLQTLLMSYFCCKLFLCQKLSLMNCSHTIGSTEWNKCFSQILIRDG